MSVLIKGLTKEKVESCFRFAKDGWCIFDMPEIIEVPTPHGRLIDANPIMKFIQDGLNNGEFGYDQIKVMGEIQYAPTVIESEELNG